MIVFIAAQIPHTQYVWHAISHSLYIVMCVCVCIYIAGYSVRLSDGPSPYEGNLQVFLPGDENWVYVCHDASMWTTQGSQVACRELGYDQAVRASGE